MGDKDVATGNLLAKEYFLSQLVSTGREESLYSVTWFNCIQHLLMED